ncbi:MAG: hypothetical protein HY819_02715 [Acidobacteria bacterium]|nr:hypothetical protein [Acidobacteriota bacterium]
MNLLSVYQETAKAGIRSSVHFQKAADKMTQTLVEATLPSKDVTTTVMKEYINNCYQTRQQFLDKMADTAEKLITDYPFKKEVEEFNSRVTENTKKTFELFSFPVLVNANVSAKK